MLINVNIARRYKHLKLCKHDNRNSKYIKHNKLKKEINNSMIAAGGVNIRLLITEQSDRKGQRKKWIACMML